jgi:hypothetical protein
MWNRKRRNTKGPGTWKCLWLAALCLVSSISTAYSDEGGGALDGGGGDPRAVEFIQISRKIESALQMRQVPGLPLDRNELKTKIDLLEESLDGPAPLITFPKGDLVDCFGAPKIGCTYAKTGRIEIAREGWEKLSTKEKYQVVMLELLKLMKVAGRYSKSGALSHFLEDIMEGQMFPVMTFRSVEINDFPWSTGPREKVHVVLIQARETERFLYEFFVCSAEQVTQCKRLSKSSVSLSSLQNLVSSNIGPRLHDLPILMDMGWGETLARTRRFLNQDGAEFLEVLKAQGRQGPIIRENFGGKDGGLRLMQQILYYSGAGFTELERE